VKSNIRKIGMSQAGMEGDWGLTIAELVVKTKSFEKQNNLTTEKVEKKNL
jgi:hypothetical protein